MQDYSKLQNYRVNQKWCMEKAGLKGTAEYNYLSLNLERLFIQYCSNIRHSIHYKRTVLNASKITPEVQSYQKICQ